MNIDFSTYDDVKTINTNSNNSIFLAGGVPNRLPNVLKDKHIFSESLFSDSIVEYSNTRGNENLKKTYLKKNTNNPILTKDNILVSNGATAAIYSSLKTLFSPHDEILILSPCWSLYLKICNSLNLHVVFCDPTDKISFRHTINDIEKSLTSKTKAILFADPSNPLSIIFDDTFKKNLINFAFNHDLYLIADETYYGLSYNPSHSILDLANTFNHLIVIRSMSKHYCIPGLRIGFIFSNECIINSIHNELLNMYLSVSALSENLALYILKNNFEDEWYKDVCLKNLSIFKSFFKNNNLVNIIEPDSAFFLCFNLQHKDATPYTASELFEKTNIIVRDGKNFRLNNYFRINLCVNSSKFKEVCYRINTLMDR